MPAKIAVAGTLGNSSQIRSDRCIKSPCVGLTLGCEDVRKLAHVYEAYNILASEHGRGTMHTFRGFLLTFLILITFLSLVVHVRHVTFLTVTTATPPAASV